MSDLISRQAAIDAFLTELTKRERKNLLHTWSTVEVKYFVVDMLEKLPSAQPDSKELSFTQKKLDTISRQAAIEALIKWYGCEPSDIGAFENIIEKMPSTQPEQRWIPVSERMPGEHEWFGTKKFGTTISNEVYVTFEAPDGQRFAKHISFQNGKLSPVDEQLMKVWFKGAKPIAWMPLPEPYKTESGDKE